MILLISVRDYVVVGHNLGFDYRFTKMAAENFDCLLNMKVLIR